MTTRPKVHRAEAARAVTAIARRRSKVDDSHRVLLPDSEDSDPRDVLDYLQKYSGPDIPRWVLQADICDALTLNNWLWWEDRRRELHFLKAGRSRGLFLSQLGGQVGVGKQGVLDRIDRLDALLRYDRPDEKITRAARHADRSRSERRCGEVLWIEQHRDDVRSVSAALIDEAGRCQLDDEDREWIDELAVDTREGVVTPTTMVMMGLAASELRTCDFVLALDSARPHSIHAILSRADRLRCAFAAVGSTLRSARDLD